MAKLTPTELIEMISNAYYEGFVEATKHEPWDDMFDWAALTGQKHARTVVQAKLTEAGRAALSLTEQEVE